MGILRRAERRGKPLPHKLWEALMAQAGLAPAPTERGCLKCLKAFHINQRDEGIDLGETSGALMATSNMQMQTFVTQPGQDGLVNAVAFAANQRDEVRNLHDVAGALQAQPGMKQQTFVMESCSIEHDVISSGITGTLRAQAHGHQPLVYENHGIDARYTGPHEVSPTTSARCGTGGNNAPLVQNETYCIVGNIIDRQPQNGGNGTGISREIAFTLTTADQHAVFRRGRTEDFRADTVASTECARQGKDATDLVLEIGSSVTSFPKLIRRLTPLECERLQGYPDSWTDIPRASDAARYKALGNSVAIPCVELLLWGIAVVYRLGLRYELPQ